MILMTDIGKDLDDSLALIYAVVAKIPIQAIVCTSKQPEESSHICANIITRLSDNMPSIYSGSMEPVKSGVIHDNIYHGYFSKGSKVFDEYDPKKLSKDEVVVIGPLTDTLDLMKNDKVKQMLFMGQARKEGWLIPDMEAYNFRCDPYASQAVFQYQDSIPMAFVGKTLAYRVPITRSDLE